jgi:hypothetical protein
MIYLHDAVYSAYPNAGVIIGNDIDSLEVLDKEHEPMVVDKNVIESKFLELQAEEEAKLQAQATVKESALAKLAKLGLTEDEVKALIL